MYGQGGLKQTSDGDCWGCYAAYRGYKYDSTVPLIV